MLAQQRDLQRPKTCTNYANQCGILSIFTGVCGVDHLNGKTDEVIHVLNAWGMSGDEDDGDGGIPVGKAAPRRHEQGLRDLRPRRRRIAI